MLANIEKVKELIPQKAPFVMVDELLQFTQENLRSISCQNKKENIPTMDKTYPFYVGTYTKGDSQGIYKYTLQEDGIIKKTGLAAKAKNPSFLTFSNDKKYLLSVSETNPKGGTGSVESFIINGDSLSLISRSSSGGAHPCFVAVNKLGFVLAANYSSGNVGLLKLNKNGELSDILDIQQHTGKGTTDRQKLPHAHSAWFDFDNLNIISIDRSIACKTTCLPVLLALETASNTSISICEDDFKEPFSSLKGIGATSTSLNPSI